MNKQLTILTGASRGMGLAMAREILRGGGTLLCISRRTNESLQADATACGATLEQWEQDLADPETAAVRLERWLSAQDAASFSEVTLINNAAMVAKIAPLSQADLPDLSRALRVGLEAPMALTAVFLRATQGWQARRKVLNISSGLGRRAMASQSAYCAAKAGMDHFTRCVALDEAAKPGGARVCSLAPGVIDTDMQVQLRGADPSQFPDLGNFTGMKEKGMLSSPEQAARNVLGYLARADFGSNPVADVRDPA